MSETYQGNYIRIKPGSARAANFLQVFGRLNGIPVVFSEPETIYDQDGNVQKAYIMSLTRLTSREMNNLAVFYADKLRLMPDEARRLIKDSVIPIYADDCEVES